MQLDLEGPRRPERHLDLFRGALAQGQAVLLLDELDDGVVRLVAADPDGLAGDHAPSEMTATSVVPPPMSTIMLPVGSCTGRPAPMAAAMGSEMMRALAGAGHLGRLLHGALLDGVMPDGTQMTMRGLAHLRWCTFWMK